MNFADFLKKIRTQKAIATAKEHYEALGGQEVLGISLRHFQQIEAGKYPPSEKLLAALFGKVPASDRRAVVLAYFRSVFESSQEGDSLVQYLDKHLLPALESEKKSIWESNRRLMMYSEAQLDYLIQNPDALRFHKRILLLESVPVKSCELSKKKLKELEELDLIEMKSSEIAPSRTLYRLPHYDNSSPRAVAKATDYILKHIDLYVSKEGSTAQELSYAVQMVSPAVAEQVLEQLRAFKRWVQSLASKDIGPQVRPLIFVGFAKQLESKEL
jgi:hypothetical protein